ncbi:MAG: mechanosensitive ion channel family protein [Candidatus Zixiibacteriota bacterium]|nr:MAG: mechanosensitive ion channel family protein [candidate division Zixibacteria bacterium]
MWEGTVLVLPNLGLALVIFVLFFLIGKGIRNLVRRVVSIRNRHRNLALVMSRLAQWIIIFLGFIVAAGIIFPSVNAQTIIGLLGISSVAIGFAFRDILQNFLAGILLLLTEPFQIEDQIIFGDFEGTVEDIQTRATYIKTYDGRRIIIPNAKLFTESVIVNTAFPHRRLEYDLGIGFGDDIEKARRLILETIHGMEEEGVLRDPAPDVLVVALAESNVNLRVRWWIKPPRRIDALITQDKVLEAIKQKLVENGIDLPFPTTQVLFHDQTEETDGDRRRQREGWPAGRDEVPEPRSIAVALEKAGDRAGALQDEEQR